MRPKLRLLSYLNKCLSSNRTGSKAVCSTSQAMAAADPMVSSHISNQFKLKKKTKKQTNFKENKTESKKSINLTS